LSFLYALRDKEIEAPCEADVLGMLSSMLLREVSQKPSYFCIEGRNAAALHERATGRSLFSKLSTENPL
jgi:hypothetical protein